MRWRACALLLLVTYPAAAVIIDRIAIVVGNSIIKDSDIDRDIRVTDFLNSDALNLSNDARKKAASRLIDQGFIHREILMGDYPMAGVQEADDQLNKITKERFHNGAALNEALRRYGLSEADLRSHFQWQLTVLRFIDARFRPAAYVSDDEIESYLRAHESALRGQYPNKDEAELRDEVRNILAGEKINQLFFAWLDEQRKSTKVKYYEESLR